MGRGETYLERDSFSEITFSLLDQVRDEVMLSSVKTDLYVVPRAKG